MVATKHVSLPQNRPKYAFAAGKRPEPHWETHCASRPHRWPLPGGERNMRVRKVMREKEKGRYERGGERYWPKKWWVGSALPECVWHHWLATCLDRYRPSQTLMEQSSPVYPVGQTHVMLLLLLLLLALEGRQSPPLWQGEDWHCITDDEYFSSQWTPP